MRREADIGDKKGSAIRATLAGATALATVLAWANPARAAADNPFGVAPMSPRELGGLRGGLNVGGLELAFAVTIKTTVEDAMAPMKGMQTTFAINDGGAAANPVTTVLGDPRAAQVAATPGGGDGEMAMQLSAGGTEVWHKIKNDHVQTLISNTDDNVVVNHSTALDITIPIFTSATSQFQAHSRVTRMGYDTSVLGLGRF